ncbi:MAG: tetratricopeptide repeat protein [Ignavibacteriae bacterium]|nr:tetratricopeptide repeat protein [Ignavibacteriota bacterium]
MIKKNKNIELKTIVALLSLSLLVSCGMWTNFKTYFNTYYNAQKLFLEAEDEIKANQKELFFFEEEKVPTNISKKFETVIEKTSAIMQYSKESDFFEDAILMTGKSFYYQQNYTRALKKFYELEAFPESDLALENKLWIAKSHLQLREFSKALDEFDELEKIAAQAEEQEILTEIYRSKIGYLIHEENYEDATAEIKNFLKSDITDELRAEVLYELGVLNIKIENYEEAELAFTEVQEYQPTFETDFNSKFELAKLKKKTGDTEKSLELLTELDNEDKFADSRDRIELEMGKIDYENGNFEDAFQTFTDIDSNFSKTEAGGEAAFYKAEILESYFNDYDSSLVIYRKAMASIADKEIKDKARNKAVLLEKYLNILKAQNKLDIDFKYLQNEELFVQDSIAFVKQEEQDSIRKVIELEQGVRASDSKTSIIDSVRLVKPIRPKISIDSVDVLKSKNYYELANLFFTEFNNPDSAYKYYNLSLAETEDNPNKAQTYYALGNYYLIKNEKQKADSMFTIVYEEFPFNRIRNEAAKQIGKPLYDFDKDPVEDEYIAAEKIYSNNEYNTAANKFYDIYKNHPNSIYASKSLYTMGFILENNLNKPDSAAAIYDTLNSKYRNTEYAKAVLLKLTGHKQEQLRLKAIQDSIKKANEPLVDKTKNAKIDSTNKQNQILSDQSGKVNKAFIDRNKNIIADTTKKNYEDKIDEELGVKQNQIIPNSNKIEEKIDSLKSEKEKLIEIEEKVKEKPNKKEVITDSVNQLSSNRIKESIETNQNLIDSTKIIAEPKVDSNQVNIIIDEVADSLKQNAVGDKTSEKTDNNLQNNDKAIPNLKIVETDIYTDGTSYYAQVSSWKTKEIAENEVKKLSTQNYNAFIFEETIPEIKATFFKIRVGPYSTLESAKEILTKLSSKH